MKLEKKEKKEWSYCRQSGGRLEPVAWESEPPHADACRSIPLSLDNEILEPSN